jgi:S1-C subfamily serine protease
VELVDARELHRALTAELEFAWLPARAFALPAARRDAILPAPNLAVGIHHRAEGDYGIAVRLQHPSAEDSPAFRRIVEEAGDQLEVAYVGRIRKLAASPPWQQRRQRPLVAGVSVGHERITAGTIGCFATDGDGHTYIVSNNHVLADENRAVEGDRIVQPGVGDGGTSPADGVATLARFVALESQGINYVDCALAELSESVACEPSELRDASPLTGVAADLALVEDVFKIGRTTGLTSGRISAFDVNYVVADYDLGNLRFDGQIEIVSSTSEAFSAPGDSGSLIVSQGQTEGVGLLFAGTDPDPTRPTRTYANPLPRVLSELAVSLLL